MAQDSDPKQYHTGGWSAHFVMIICTLLFVVNYMDRQVFSAVLQPMKIDLGLTDAQAGGVATAFTLGMAIFSFPIAWMVDRWSRKKAVGIMALLWSGFTFLTGMASSFISLIIPRVLVGLGEAGFVPGGNALISGFVLEGGVSARVLLRGVGPGLAQFGASNTVADPVVSLYDTPAPSAS